MDKADASQRKLAPERPRGQIQVNIPITAAPSHGVGPSEVLMAGNTKAVTDASFSEDVLKATGPVVVDFWAEWCGPCRAISPALEEISAEYAGKLTIAKVNIDENPETPNNYAVRGIPTLILFKNGKPAATQVGAAPKSVLKAWIERSL
jgi:thioredoxin 1